MYSRIIFIIISIIVSMTNAIDEQPISSSTSNIDLSDWGMNDDDDVDPITNNLIDQMLDGLKKNSQIEEYNLHEEYEMDIVETFMFSWDPCYGKCKIRLSNATVYGLANMTRYGNGIMTNDGDDLVLRFRLQAYNLRMKGVMSLKLVGYSVTDAPFINQVGYQIQFIDLSIGKKNKISLRELRVEQIEDIQMEFTRFQDSKILKKFSDMISKKMLAMMEDQMAEISTRIFFPILEGELKYMGKDEEEIAAIQEKEQKSKQQNV
ncbi:uncharacterized protein LOC124494497 [Dermatophagoides farinae]|uniref:uncharacterized protein LOC124494497 n=1 Tax=Dermatophagoides farinae TaxID=6954 RepID=UPI001F0D32F0|nr:uncharacterized protein LOC124494497 [Dermatophagoides farinae]